MDTNIKRAHYYHADATAFGGYLERPIKQTITSQAPVSLPAAGGYASARVDKFKLAEVISFEAAYTQVAGSMSTKEGGGWTTLMTAVVEGFNVLDVVTADRIVAQVSTEHPLVGYVPRITLLGTEFDNLRIGGRQVELVLDTGLFGQTGTGYPQAPYIEDKQFVSRLVGPSGLPTSASSRASGKCHVAGSIVKQATGDFVGKSLGHVLDVPEFGKIHLGQLIVDSESVHLIMIYLELGCLGDGRLSGPCVKSNGNTQP